MAGKERTDLDMNPENRAAERVSEELAKLVPESKEVALALEVLRATKQGTAPSDIPTPDSSNTIVIPRAPTLRAL